MRSIRVVYEALVFRPLRPVKLPEGSLGEVLIASEADQQTPQETVLLDGGNQDSPDNASEVAESAGQRAYRLLMEIAALPHTSIDGRTDVAAQHDEILYPKQGRMP